MRKKMLAAVWLEDGASLVEYGMLVAALTAVCIASMMTVILTFPL
jgi:Flp pilus assembly pilin Flp